MNNNEIFEQFWRNYKWPDPQPTPQYRVYYNDDGDVVAYTTEDLPGKYLTVTAHEFALASRRVRVKDGQLVARKQVSSHKLVPSDTGTACHPHDVAVIVGPDQPHQKWHRR